VLRLVEPGPLTDPAPHEERHRSRSGPDRDYLASLNRTPDSGTDRDLDRTDLDRTDLDWSNVDWSGRLDRGDVGRGDLNRDRDPGRNGAGHLGAVAAFGAAAAINGERSSSVVTAFARDPGQPRDHIGEPPLHVMQRAARPDEAIRRPAEPISTPPVIDEGDGDLLIFAQARSAWFTGHLEQEEVAPAEWANPADLGWQAAERASQPVQGDETSVGLPRRVPQANLVPGSPLPPAPGRSLRIVRDPAAMAAHTTGYFRGSRRGEEVRGFAVGGRPGREAPGGWDFSRDGWEADRDDRDYEYRSASHR
jgi:hypothetical protein